ncbi:hypothetical protein [Paenibacillus pasadenensis]|uniref:hypothetical protein n=1 Tax=Paenibacillus pasadenensis TaxID=217090 RepID=UPI00203ADCDA|nr:hypothetical protein [Paenibacillus pasadenensis]
MRLAIIPAYSLIMLVVSFDWELRSLLNLAILIVCAYCIAALQVSGVKVKTAHSKGQQIVEMRTGMKYMYGWFAVVIIIIISEYASGELESSRALREELMKEMVPYIVFSKGTDNWMLWAITGLTSLFFVIMLMRKHPAVHAVLFNKMNRYRK